MDLSPVAFPEGACAVVNLTPAPVQALVGTRGRPVAVAPGACAVIPSFDRDAEGRALTRVAMAAQSGVLPLTNELREYPKSARSLLVVQVAEPNLSGGRPAMVKLMPLPELAVASAPAGTTAAPKAAAAK